MKKFEHAVQLFEQQNNLKRVRLKLDPKIREAQDFSQYDGYEGYVLSETETQIELQLIGGKKITVPRIVLEGKLADFLKGLAPQTSKKVSDVIKTRVEPYLDPNVAGATKAGMAVRDAAQLGAKAINPMTYLKGAERIMTAPLRAIAGDNKNATLPDAAERVQIGMHVPITQQDLAAKFNIAANLSTPDESIEYFSLGDESQPNPATNNEYIVLHGSKQLIMPSGTRYNLNISTVPFSSAGINLLTYLNVNRSQRTAKITSIDDVFIQNLKDATQALAAEIDKIDADHKYKLIFDIIHIPTRKVFEVGGYVVAKSGKHITLSEKQK